MLHYEVYRLPWWLRWWSVCLQCGRPGFNPWVGKVSWRRKWQPTPVSCLENPRDGGVWWATVRGVTKSRTRLSDFTFTMRFISISFLLIAGQCPIVRRNEILINATLWINLFGEGNGNPLQCSCLENPRDGWAWWAAVYGVAQSRTQLKQLSSRLIITFLPRSKRLLISWLQSPSAVILEPRKIKSATVSTVSPSICHEVMGPDAMILVFWILSFKTTFHSPLSLLSRGPLVLLHFLP